MLNGSASGQPETVIELFGATLLCAFDDADISHDRIAQQLPCGLVRGAVVRSNCARDAVELYDDCAQVHSCLKCFGRRSSNQVASARGPYCGPGQLRVLGEAP